MVDFNKLIGSITGSGLGTGLAGGVAGGALVSAMTTKTGRKAATSVAKIGGLAAVGALAWGAYKKYQNSNNPAGQSQPAPIPAPDPAPGIATNAVHGNTTADTWQQLPQQHFDVLASNAATSQGLLVLRTMIAAAMADGHLGPEEQVQIFERLDSLGLSTEERSTLFDELRNPLACDALASQVSDPVVAIEMYTAAVMTVDTDCLTAGEFLRQLSVGLHLPDQLVSSIDASASNSKLAVA